LAPCVLLAAIVALAGCDWRGKPAGVGGKLSVLVRPPDRKQEPVAVESPGALPALTGGAMYLEAQLDKPAFVYLIWIDAAGKIKPLYPWNNETIEVTDFSQPPPVRRATNRVFSPMLGHDWTLDGPPGTETVLFLVRTTAIPEDVDLAELFATLPPPPPPTLPEELTTYKAYGGGKSVLIMRHNATSDTNDDEPLKVLLLDLAEHFDLIQAVRFAHQDPETDQPNPSSSR
jgi:hypothetical protein